METETIDIEPSWESIGYIILQNPGLNISEKIKALLPALRIADRVRQAQKSGAKSIIFSFPEGKNGKTRVDIALDRP